jgi:hypothetical protein
LIKAVQEQQEIIKSQGQDIEMLKKKQLELEKMIKEQ